MQTVDLRLDAGWILPVEPAGALAGHALVVDAGRIVALRADGGGRCAPTRRASTLALPRHALIPGLVNAHTHAAMTLFRGIADDVPLQVWLEQHIWPREGRFAAPDFVYDGALPRRRRDAARRHHLLQRHVLLSRRHRAGAARRRNAGDARAAGARLPDALRGGPGRLPAEGARRPRRVHARAAARLLAVAARAVHGRRPGVGEDDHLRARNSTCRSRPTSPRPPPRSRRAARPTAPRRSPDCIGWARPGPASSPSTPCTSTPPTSTSWPRTAGTSSTARRRT